MIDYDIEIKKCQLEKLQIELQTLKNNDTTLAQQEKSELEIKSLKKQTSLGLWNSLEVVKLIISLSVPILLFVITKQTNDRLKDIEAKEHETLLVNQSLLENNKRIYEHRYLLYQEVSLKLNHILCYFNYVGRWKELSPIQIIEDKRFCDERIYSNAILFSHEFVLEYRNFIRTAFKEFSGEGFDAKLKTDLNAHKINFPDKALWSKNNWDKYFMAPNEYNEIDIQRSVFNKYNDLLKLIAKELAIEEYKPTEIFENKKPPASKN
jgi:hypothetical protein